ncbi:CBS domain-containing protein [Carbonactinospora thermoautotrophica]|uniref:CBS domain containing protein n=1 Tax=Carbonactinospora thermoautotrophica TaxID=1469144 RepID=A0A132MMP2_9ACTN|nr:CBS domain-containing protein [Carbonactinospora thermoautotrophica]KWW98989.1 CBS domain containing protein [Carbonactinospora thermoautotrophica]MCX9193647.1 CBS domain-containing protein [Carbonactinospora thermoautotrophica]
MRVSDVMTQASISDSPSDTLRSAAERMWGQQTGSLVVMEGEQLVGIITERDILKAAAQGVDLDKTPVGDLMTREVQTVPPDRSIRDAARMMAQHWIRHLPVVDGGKVVGVLSQRDIVGIFAALWQEDDNIEIEADKLVREQRLKRLEHGDLD